MPGHTLYIFKGIDTTAFSSPQPDKHQATHPHRHVTVQKENSKNAAEHCFDWPIGSQHTSAGSSYIHGFYA
jgi:hypothetical protein